MKPRVVAVKEKQILEQEPPSESQWVFLEKHGTEAKSESSLLHRIRKLLGFR